MKNRGKLQTHRAPGKARKEPGRSGSLGEVPTKKRSIKYKMNKTWLDTCITAGEFLYGRVPRFCSPGAVCHEGREDRHRRITGILRQRIHDDL